MQEDQKTTETSYAMTGYDEIKDMLKHLIAVVHQNTEENRELREEMKRKEQWQQEKEIH